MEFRILGPLEVVGTGNAAAISADTQRAILAVLLVHANQVVSCDRLLEEVWGEAQPTGGLKTLRYHISKLRDVLESQGGDRGEIETRPSGYRLRLETGALDARVFEDRVGRAWRVVGADPAQALALVDEALGLWRGEPLADLAYRPFIVSTVRRLEELRLEAIEVRSEALLVLGRCNEAITELEQACDIHPLRERLWGLLMQGLYRADRQAEALEAFQRLRIVLGEQLGIEPSRELRLLEEQILTQHPALTAPVVEVRPASNLPERLTSFVGRHRELTEVGKLLSDARVVTLTGPGGSGKTRLALEVAEAALGIHPHGAWLVELASVTEPGLVAEQLARVLEVRERPGRSILAGLVEFIHDRRLLLVVDNCEHLVEAVAEVCMELLHRAPGVRVLATSREPLGISGEVVYPVGSLELPHDALSLTELAGVEAVRLFTDRAELANPTFQLTEDNANWVREICVRLDGLPLALELAAARVRMLAPVQIANHLDDRFRLLTLGARTTLPRQRTLRAAVDWSYELLDEQEQALFDRLSVFAGPFSLEAAERVGASGRIEAADVLDLVGRLVDKSLLVVSDPVNGVRYRMLETLSAYGAERLADRGESEMASRRHADFYRDLVMGGVDEIREQDRRWMDRLEVELDDLRRALGWSLQHGDTQMAVELGGGLLGFWLHRAYRSEARRWFSRLRALTGLEESPSRARVLEGFGAFTGEPEESAAAFEEAAAMYRRLGDTRSLWKAVMNLGFCLVKLGEAGRAKEAFGEAALVMQAAGDRHGCVWQALGHLIHEEGDRALARQLFQQGVEVAIRTPGAPCDNTSFQWMAALERYEGNLERARRLLGQAVELARAQCMKVDEPMVMAEQAMVLRDEGDLDGAMALLREALGRARPVGELLDEETFVVWFARRLASLETLGGNFYTAVLLFGAVDAHARVDFETWYDFERLSSQAYVDRARSALDPEAFAEAWARGQTMCVSQLRDELVRQLDGTSRVIRRRAVSR